MKVTKRIAVLLIILLVLVPGLVMAGGGKEESKEAAPDSPYGGRLNVGWTSEQAVDSLQFGEDWELGDMGTVFWQLIYDQLWMIGPPPDYAVVPRLVERWETEDRQTWTFHIVRNAKRIVSEADRLNRLAGELLDYSRGEIRLNMQIVNLPEFVTEFGRPGPSTSCGMPNGMTVRLSRRRILSSP